MEFTTGIEQTRYKKVHKVRQNKGKKTPTDWSLIFLGQF